MANAGRSGEVNRDQDAYDASAANGERIMRTDPKFGIDYTETGLQYNRAGRDEDSSTHNPRDYKDNSDLPGYGR